MSTKPINNKGKISLTNQILIATIIGIIAGLILGPKIAPIKFLGDIFLRLIMMGVPLIILGSVTVAVGQISPKELGKLGFKIFAWFLGGTIISAIIGITFGYILKPGEGLPAMELVKTIEPTKQTIFETFVNFIPNNILDSLAKTNMIHIIVFAIFLGTATSSYVDKKGDRTILELMMKGNDILLIIIKNVMKIAPIGVGALIAVVSGSMGLNVITLMIKYLGGLFLACGLVMILAILVTAARVKVNPWKLAKKLGNMTLVAATTTSSAITLPTKMDDSVNKLGVSKRISDLVNPLGMAMNSCGQAVFMSMASLMLLQFFNMDASLGKVIQIVAVATLGCMGSLAVPGGGLVVFVSMMPVLGLPVEGIALIAGVDWFRGAITTVPNVDIDALVALIIADDEGEFNRDIFDEKTLDANVNA
ncbi:dicarboxylate/amino acid:cation symporter [Clostridium sp.]|uniref:dicarboxylate/amino acid:cation symporter n=1 Tax=Clostridium sp. TaxID=1506 RepID=UPI002FCA6DC2